MMQGMELIRHRRSVRTFDGAALRPEDAEKLIAFAEAQENPYGLPITWKLLSLKADGLSTPVIAGADAFLGGKMKRAPHAEEAFGYAMERVVLQAEAMGLGTTWIAGTMDRPAFERAMDLQPDEVMPCVTPLGVPAKHMSLRETMMRKGVRADRRFDFGEVFLDGDFTRPLTEDAAGAWREPLEMVRWAPSAVNKQPWRVVLRDGAAHLYEQQSKGYVDASGWDVQRVDAGIALCHLCYGLEQQGLKPAVTVADPGLPLPENTLYIATVTPAGAP